MSLTSKVNGKRPQDRVLRDLLMSTMPDKAFLRTGSGRTVFAVDEYEIRVPYDLTSSGLVGLVGTTFNFLLRALVASTDGRSHFLAGGEGGFEPARRLHA